MIDRGARERAIQAIQRFRDGSTTSEQFDEEYPPSSTDPALKAIAGAIWFTYDDLEPHRLTGSYALPPATRRGFDRSVVFLASDEEYVPEPGLVRRVLGAMVGRTSAAGTSKHSLFWPFRSLEAYAQAMEQLGPAGAETRRVAAEYESGRIEIAQQRHQGG